MSARVPWVAVLAGVVCGFAAELGWRSLYFTLGVDDFNRYPDSVGVVLSYLVVPFAALGLALLTWERSRLAGWLFYGGVAGAQAAVMVALGIMLRGI